MNNTKKTSTKQRNMRTILKKVADVRTGYTFRGKIEEADDGNVRVLQIRDLRKQFAESNRTELVAHELPLIHWNGGDSAMLKPGDIVLPARGEHYNAAIFPGAKKVADSSPQQVIATSQLLIIKTTKDDVLPGFLCWTMNQPEVQHYLTSESKGTSIPLLSRKSLDMLTLSIPPMEKQKKIIELQKLWEQEQHLTKQLLTNRENMLKGMCKALLNEHS